MNKILAFTALAFVFAVATREMPAATAVAAEAAPPAVSASAMPAPSAPFDTTEITPVETAGAARGD